MSSTKSLDMTGSTEPAWEQAVRKAVRALRYGSVEVQVHDGRVVQVETREKVRFADDRRPDDRRRNPQFDGLADRTPGGTAPPPEETNPAKGQWGAVELAARVQGLEVARASADAGLIDPSRSPRKILAWTAGLNWHLTRNLKEVVNFGHASFTGGAAGGRDRASENVFFIRTQLSF